MNNTDSISDVIQHCKEDIHPPLYFMLVAFWKMILPSSEFSLRLLSIIFGMVSLVGVFLVGRSISGWQVGLGALCIAAFSPYHWLYSTELRPYAMLMAFSAFSIWSFLRAVQGGHGRHYYVLFAATVLNLYTSYFAVFLILSQIVAFIALIAKNCREGSWAIHYRNRQIFRMLLTIFLVALAFLPWIQLFMSIFREAVMEGGTVGVGSRIGRGVTPRLVGRTLFSFMGQGWIPFLFQSLFALTALFNRKLCRTTILVVALWVVPFLLLIIFKPTHFIAPRYFLFIYPIMIPLVAAGVRSFADRIGDGISEWGIALAFLLLSIMPLLPAQHPSYVFHRSGWRSVSEEIRNTLREGDAIAFPDDRKSYCMVHHYLGREFFKEHSLLNWTSSNPDRGYRPAAGDRALWLVKRNRLPDPLSEKIGEEVLLVKQWEIYPETISLYVEEGEKDERMDYEDAVRHVD